MTQVEHRPRPAGRAGTHPGPTTVELSDGTVLAVRDEGNCSGGGGGQG